MLFESVGERRIREAMERGDFDDLPGAGGPLRHAGKPYEPTWWVREWVKRNRLDSDATAGTTDGDPAD